MPWTAARVLDLDPGVSQSFLPNNLACDGDGRYAFIHGTRVQCTRRISTPAGRCDFTLAYSEDLEVSSVYWWTGLAKYGRALLVLTTESTDKSPATIQIWNAWRGTGSRVFRSSIETLETDTTKSKQSSPENHQHHTRSDSAHSSSPTHVVSTGFPSHVRGISQASSSPGGQVLFCGSSTGAVYGILHKEGRGGGFHHACTLLDLTSPISALGSDKGGSDLLAAADEEGNLLVWRIEEEVDSNVGDEVGYCCQVVYRYSADEDLVCSIGVRDEVVVAGHASGAVTFHDLSSRRLVASTVTNTCMVTTIDVHHNRKLVLVCGEDCRVSVLGFPTRRGTKLVVYFSVAVTHSVVGSAFFTTREGLPGVAVLQWSESKILRFEYTRGERTRATYSGLRSPPSPAVESSGSSTQFPSRLSCESLVSHGNYRVRRRSFAFSGSREDSHDGSSTSLTLPPQ
jgi:hypothetical protein